MREKQKEQVQVVMIYYYEHLQQKFEMKKCMYVTYEKNYVKEKKG